MNTRGPKPLLGAGRQPASKSPSPSPRQSDKATNGAAQRTGTGTPGAPNIGSADWIKQQLQTEQLWGYFALSGKWVCPYCLSAVNRRSGRSREDSISTHLESCRGFNKGLGQIQKTEAIERRQQYENLIHLADTDPAWRVYDQTGSWYCPACLDRVPTVRIQGGQLTNFVYQAMAEHLNRCGTYSRGVQPKPEDVQRARDRAARFPVLVDTLHQNLQFPVWRYIDAMGLWVCPCCLKHVSRVRVVSDADWQRAPEQIAQHLLQECSSYTVNPQFLHSEAQVREAATNIAPLVQPPGVAVPATPKNSLINRTPMFDNQVPIARPVTPANGSAKIPPQNTPPIAKPLTGNATGRFSLTPPSAPPSVLTPTKSITTKRSETTSLVSPARSPSIPPIALPPAVAAPAHTTTSAKWSAPNAGETQLPPSPSYSTAPESAEKIQPNSVEQDRHKDATLFGALDDNFLNHTALGDIDNHQRDVVPAEAVDADQLDLASSEHHFNWMDEADNPEPIIEMAEPNKERSDMMKARAVQQGLLQKPPEIPGFAFGAAYEACSDISGDFYQFIRLPDGRVGFAMGDVSGHGVQAGLIMSMAKKTFEIYASMGLTPADTLGKVNDAIARDLGGKLFVSMVYALLDPTERTITWARAGHTPSIRYNPDSDLIEEIKPPGMVVGMKTGAQFRNSLQEQVITVKSGDVIVLYTDGVTETMNLQQEEFETERLFDVIKKFGAEGPDILPRRIMEIIRHFRGPQPPTDDVTLLTLHVE
jgi:serine phosphatase RsbU (regulator of sigma subunit)